MNNSTNLSDADLVTVLTFFYPPYAMNCTELTLLPTDDCRMPGLSAENLGHILHYAGLNYQLIFSPVLTGGYVNGTWTGLFEWLQEGSIDTTSLYWYIIAFACRSLVTAIH